MDQKPLLEVGDAVYNHYLLTKSEYDHCKRILKYKTLTHWEARLETKKLDISTLDKWRDELTLKEIETFNKNIDKLLKLRS